MSMVVPQPKVPLPSFTFFASELKSKTTRKLLEKTYECQREWYLRVSFMIVFTDPDTMYQIE
jgi:hypothetical protein